MPVVEFAVNSFFRRALARPDPGAEETRPDFQYALLPVKIGCSVYGLQMSGGLRGRFGARRVDGKLRRAGGARLEGTTG